MQMGQLGLSMPNQAPVSMQMAMPQHISMQMSMPGMGNAPMGQRQVKIENMMTMEDVENLLKSQRKVEENPKVEVTPKVQEALKETAVHQKEIQKKIPKEIKVDSKKDSRENLTNVKEKKNRVHLEKIQRASQAERRMDKSKNKNLQGFFYKKESDGTSARKKDVFITKWEKELIAKIQISQLISNDPMKDDFYYEIYSSFSKKPEEAPVKESGKSKKRASGANKIQQQMTRLIEKRKSKITEVKGPSNLLDFKKNSVIGRSSRENFCIVFKKSKTGIVFGYWILFFKGILKSVNKIGKIKSGILSVSQKCFKFN